MKASVLMAAVLADLAAFASAEAGVGRIKPVLSREPFHTLELLAASPAGFLLIVQDDGDEPLPGTLAQDALLRQNFSVFVGLNAGLQVDRAKALTDDTGTRPSLLDLCGQVRERVVSKGQTVSTAGNTSYPEYIGRTPVVLPDGTPLAAYQLRFSTEYAGDGITQRPPA